MPLLLSLVPKNRAIKQIPDMLNNVYTCVRIVFYTILFHRTNNIILGKPLSVFILNCAIISYIPTCNTHPSFLYYFIRFSRRRINKHLFSIITLISAFHNNYTKRWVHTFLFITLTLLRLLRSPCPETMKY